MGKRSIAKREQNPKVSSSVSLVFEASLSHLPSLTKIIESICKIRNLNECVEYEIILAVNESVSNSIQHAYFRNADNIIKVNLFMDSQVFTCELFEENPLVNKDIIKPSSIAGFIESQGEKGFGMALIYHYMDEVKRESIENGYKWILKKALV